MKRLLRSTPPAPPPSLPGLEAAIQAAKANHYRDGLADGMAITLLLVLGRPAGESPPYPGPRPPELEAWAQSALRRITASGVDVGRF